jgi:tetratricopeptide (TPR) repeat protein
MRGLATIATVVVLIAIGGPALSATQQDYDACNQTTDLDRGILACTTIITDQSEAVVDRVLAYLQRGNMYAATDRLDLAITDYSEAIKLDPRNVLAYASRAIAYFRKGDREHAIADFRQADTLDPIKLADMIIANAELKEIGSAAVQGPVAVVDSADSDQCGDVNNAEKADLNIAACDRILNAPKATSQDRVASFSRRCALLVTKKDPDHALSYCNQAILIDPHYSRAYGNRANAYSAKGDKERAIADYNEGIRLNPNDAITYYNRGNLYRGKGEYDRAFADFNEAIRLDPISANAYAGRGTAYYNTGDYDRAIADFNEAIRYNPKTGYAYYIRGNVYYNKQDYDRAIADYSEAIRINPDNPDAHASRGNAHYKIQDCKRAIADYDEAIRLDPKLASVYAIPRYQARQCLS